MPASHPPTLRALLCCLGFCVACCATGAETVYLAPDTYTRFAAPADPQAAALRFDEAARAAAQGEPSRALSLATETLALDPDHAEARRVLGYERVDGRWLTPYQERLVGRGQAWDPRFGWSAVEDLPRLEAGERRHGRRWVSAETDAKLHAEIADGWQVRSDHFVVTTNHSLAAAAALAEELERYCQAWRQLFAGYCLSEREVRLRFEGQRDARDTSATMNVFLHRDRAGYVEHLRRRQPRIGETLGIYFDTLREAHFYDAGDGAGLALQLPTVYHEAGHQLFQEMGGKGKAAGLDANFWAVEGVACWLETLTPQRDSDGRLTYRLGAGDSGRLPAAKRRLLGGEGPMPVAQLAALGQADLQRRPNLAAVYGQSAALAGMLMQGEGGRWREPFVGFLGDLYRSRPDSEALLRATDASGDELDRAYRNYLRNLSP
ncbi:hypothetical protein Mal64_30400 [Pseudobythopirellula maris]|uniref:DUF1570 domain-containing protein n=1 Tax=Pseudobythopirellula maris TaxID=2527991 RepID=A0A5C5ZJW4_9BACT|nr:hypothetical protein [Pseudobythopirellula maris]TWT87500.1 hypothetical protein Mal64_30400 [Pseudobythopirellula maris]